MIFMQFMMKITIPRYAVEMDVETVNKNSGVLSDSVLEIPTTISASNNVEETDLPEISVVIT